MFRPTCFCPTSCQSIAASAETDNSLRSSTPLPTSRGHAAFTTAFGRRGAGLRRGQAPSPGTLARDTRQLSSRRSMQDHAVSRQTKNQYSRLAQDHAASPGAQHSTGPEQSLRPVEGLGQGSFCGRPFVFYGRGTERNHPAMSEGKGNPFEQYLLVPGVLRLLVRARQPLETTHRSGEGRLQQAHIELLH